MTARLAGKKESSSSLTEKNVHNFSMCDTKGPHTSLHQHNKYTLLFLFYIYIVPDLFMTKLHESYDDKHCNLDSGKH